MQEENQMDEVTHFSPEVSPAREAGAHAIRPAQGYLDQIADADIGRGLTTPDLSFVEPENAKSDEELADVQGDEEDAGDFLSEEDAAALDEQDESSEEEQQHALYSMDAQLNMLRERMKTLWQYLPEDDPDVKLLREFAEGETALVPGSGESREVYLKKMRRIVAANAIASAKSKAIILEGQPLDIVLEMFDPKVNQVLPWKPMEHLVAAKVFRQDLAAFEFYSKNFGYAVILNSGPMVDFTSRNIARIRFAEYLKEQGYARVATPEELEKILQSIKDAQQTNTKPRKRA